MKITLVPNGPYRVSNGSVTALCRCGGSKNKPYCDGTHAKIGFSDRNDADSATHRRDTYSGKSITIFDNRAICAHAGFCTERLKKVFRLGAEPWIDPDGAAAEAIRAAIEQCPSGALAYAAQVAPGREPQVVPTADGPYAVTGSVELVDVAFGDGASREHYTLCRCGGSKNKPFCDGTHWRIGFKAP